MSALPQPDLRDVVDSSWKLQTHQEKTIISNLSVTSSKKTSSKTTKLSRKKHSSAALQLLTLLQQGSSYLAAVMMLASIGLYLATVRIPQLWSQEYKTLEALQRQERNLVAIDEALKYEIAQQAEQPELDMSGIAPENTMFLQPNHVEPQETAIADNNSFWQSIPLGY
ncbi:conserved hypothetical protein [Hyella patelloides LEGE 07179]|uniref:Cell division protein FtsL n=2 Tax=Hyella TaxID=945733 RepID=A0A563VIW5_9CYAN|nr:conserved hypothetical protein [Hyella patelloides LEGE 07179]